MELSFGRKKGPPASPAQFRNNNQNNQVIGDDRLQKAIARNRAKQAKRERDEDRVVERNPPEAPSRGTSRFSHDRDPGARPTGRRNQEYSRGTTRNLPRDVIQDNPSMETRRPNRSYSPSQSQPSGRRSGFQRTLPEDNFQEPSEGFRARRAGSSRVSNIRSRVKENNFVDRLKKKALAPVEKFLESSNWTKLNKQFVEWGLKVGWCFCIILIARLFVTERGVIDYYAQQDLLNEKNFELMGHKKENLLLLKEIELIKNNTKYQKKLVRSHLGHISKDEFLILSPKKKSK